MHTYVVFSTRSNDNTSHDNKSGIRRVCHRTSKIASFKKQWTLIKKKLLNDVKKFYSMMMTNNKKIRSLFSLFGSSTISYN